MTDSKLPLDGIRVLDFTHNVMGPTTGMLMGDLGADGPADEPARRSIWPSIHPRLVELIRGHQSTMVFEIQNHT